MVTEDFDILKGTRIVELTAWISGPYAGAILAGLGAEVIKVEPPQGDSWRGDTGYFSFPTINRNKKGVVIDLKKDEGRKVFYDLVKISDVFIENLAPEAIKKLKVTYDDLHKINERIIYISIKGFGEGPYENETVTDPATQAFTGSMELTGHPDRPPARTIVSYIDDATAVYAALAAVTALWRRERTGKGTFIELTLFDVASEFITNNLLNYYVINGKLLYRLGSGYPSLVPYRVYKTKDGYVYTGARSDRAWRALCEILGLGHMADDPRFRTNKDRIEHRKEVDGIIEGATVNFTTEELVKKLKETGLIIAVPVRTMDKLLTDPHLAYRRLLIDMPDPKYGTLKVARASIRADGGYVDGTKERAPMLGEHTVEVLEKTLGYGEDRISKLLEDGVIVGK